MGVGMAGGNAYWSGNTTFSWAAITVSQLQSCGLTNITNFVQDGVTGPFAADDYMGFSFRATDPADGKTHDYEYALQGVTNTQVVITNTLYAPPTNNAAAEIAATTRAISDLQQSRMNMLSANQPSLTALLDPADPTVTMGGTDAAGMIQTGASVGPVWGRFAASWSKADGTKSDYALASFGTHYRMSENALVGAMLQFDRITDDSATWRTEGTGWLAGPYFVARVPDHEFYVEGMSLWGKTSNDISPFRTYTDSVDGDRNLTALKVSTRFDQGAFAFRPYLSASHMSEETDSYTDSNGNLIPKVKNSANQVMSGIGVERSFDLDTGLLRVGASLGGIWTNTTNGLDADYEGGRGRVSFDVGYNMGAAGNIAFSAYFDGLGMTGYESRAAALVYSLSF